MAVKSNLRILLRFFRSTYTGSWHSRAWNRSDLLNKDSNYHFWDLTLAFGDFIFQFFVLSLHHSDQWTPFRIQLPILALSPALQSLALHLALNHSLSLGSHLIYPWISLSVSLSGLSMKCSLIKHISRSDGHSLVKEIVFLLRWYLPHHLLALLPV